MSVRTQKDKLGKNNIVCDRRWPDGTRFRRVMPNRTLAKKVDARIAGAIAEGKWRQLKEELQRGSSLKGVTFSQFADQYLNDYCKIHNRSWKRKRTSLDFLKKKIGSLPLEEIGPKHFLAYIHWRKENGISNATINRDLTSLKHLMVYASDPEIGALDQNRIAKVKKLEEIREERPRPTDEQIDHLLGCMDLRIRPIIGLIRETGCRLEEGLSLKHTQIRKQDRIVVFSCNTKTCKPRFVPLTDEAIQWIEEMPQLPGCPYVFWHPKSRTRWYNIRKVFNKARKDANFDWFLIKDLRRHYGIILSENGAEMHVIQAMLGHSSVTITEKHYAHFSPHYAARRAFQVLQGRKKGGINRELKSA